MFRSLPIFCLVSGLSLFFTACGGMPKFKNVEEVKKNDEFDRAVKIEEAPADIVPPPAPPPKPEVPKVVEKRSGKKSVKKSAPVEKKLRRLPELESDVGFIEVPPARRPLVDPFRIGEKVVHSVRWMQFNAGTLTMEVLPFASVNGRLNYNSRMAIATSTIFSTFHSVDDFVTTLVDYETLVPSVFKLSVRESNQVREAQSFFDFDRRQARFWEKKVTKEEGETQRKLEWEILDYSQNVYSSLFYIRNFTYQDGGVYPFRVANEGENLIFKAKVVRREKLKTKVGDFPAVVILPEIELKGKYKPIGDNLMWLSDDDRKYILRIESKIAIGTLVSEITELIPGKN